ncbi:MAG: cyclic lactone autoinducer peptide [Firmicutes bacterium]|nr:cyclic lactone autoinducer peptide [Bacillota bacterium]
MKKFICSLLTSVLMVLAAANLASACLLIMYQPELKE